jgi:hypothetical protein
MTIHDIFQTYRDGRRLNFKQVPSAALKKIATEVREGA